MQDADLLLSLAEIAGVFVGFGALIGIRGGGTSEAYEVTFIRFVVSIGLLVIVAALAPVTISRYGLTGHDVWLLCSLLALAFFWGMMLVANLMPEHRTVHAVTPRAALVRRFGLFTLLFIVPMHLALILVVLGLLPNVEPALYLTAVVVALAGAALGLLSLVYSQGRPASA